MSRQAACKLFNKIGHSPSSIHAARGKRKPFEMGLVISLPVLQMSSEVALCSGNQLSAHFLQASRGGKKKTNMT